MTIPEYIPSNFQLELLQPGFFLGTPRAISEVILRDVGAFFLSKHHRLCKVLRDAVMLVSACRTKEQRSNIIINPPDEPKHLHNG
jgi:hypothetical protein